MRAVAILAVVLLWGLLWHDWTVGLYGISGALGMGGLLILAERRLRRHRGRDQAADDVDEVPGVGAVPASLDDGPAERGGE